MAECTRKPAMVATANATIVKTRMKKAACFRASSVGFVMPKVLTKTSARKKRSFMIMIMRFGVAVLLL